MKGLLALVVLPLAIPVAAIACLVEVPEESRGLYFRKSLAHSIDCDRCKINILKIYLIVLGAAALLVLP